jgi:hypothetical protein
LHTGSGFHAPIDLNMNGVKTSKFFSKRFIGIQKHKGPLHQPSGFKCTAFCKRTTIFFTTTNKQEKTFSCKIFSVAINMVLNLIALKKHDCIYFKNQDLNPEQIQLCENYE